MNETLVAAIEHLGAEGIQAIQLYLVLDYTALMVIVGLVTWGVRVVWRWWVKETSSNKSSWE